MALVGSIRVGTIAGLIDSLKRTNVNATLLLQAGEEKGTVIFREGELEQCSTDVLEDADALDEMLSWSHGQFNLRLMDAETKAEEVAPRGIHVMVVDDELGVRKLIETFLEAEGYQVSVVSQGSQAINLVEYCKPDVVLLDVMLAGLDGFDVARMLREQYDEDELAILMISANHDFEQIALVEGLPFMGKPFDFKKLCATIDQIGGVPADWAVAQRMRSPAPEEGVKEQALHLPVSFAQLLDVESCLPDLDTAYELDEVTRARISLAELNPVMAATIAAFDGQTSLRALLHEDPDQRDLRVLIALLLNSVDALRTPEVMPDKALEVAAAAQVPLDEPLLGPDEADLIAPVALPGFEEEVAVVRVAAIGTRSGQNKLLRRCLSSRRATQYRLFPELEGHPGVPWFADDELIRFPLSSRLLLVVHEVASANHVEALVSRFETDDWGFLLYFRGLKQFQFSLDLVPSVTSFFAAPVIAAGVARPEDEARITELVESGRQHPHFHGVVLLEEGALDAGLRTVLLSLG